MISSFLRRIANAIDSQSKGTSSQYDLGQKSAGSILLRGSGDYNFEVVGEAQCQPALERISGGRKFDGVEVMAVAVLALDNANSHDANAVAVFIDASRVGYLPRETAKRFREDIARLNPSNAAVGCRAKIVGGWDRGNGDRGHFGVWLDVSVPLEIASRSR